MNIKKKDFLYFISLKLFNSIQLSLFTSHSPMCDIGHVKLSLQAIPRL
jgi:hypothetical protein